MERTNERKRGHRGSLHKGAVSIMKKIVKTAITAILVLTFVSPNVVSAFAVNSSSNKEIAEQSAISYVHRTIVRTLFFGSMQDISYPHSIQETEIINGRVYNGTLRSVGSTHTHSPSGLVTVRVTYSGTLFHHGVLIRIPYPLLP